MQTRGRQSSIENGQMGTRLPNLVTDESSEDGDAFQEPPELPEEGPAVEGGSFIRRPVTNDPKQTLIERVTVGVPGDGVERQKAADKSYEGVKRAMRHPLPPRTVELRTSLRPLTAIGRAARTTRTAVRARQISCSHTVGDLEALQGLLMMRI